MLDETAKTFIIVGCVFGILTTFFACCFACSVLTEFKARIRRSVGHTRRRSRNRHLYNEFSQAENGSSHYLKSEKEKDLDILSSQVADLREYIIEVPVNLQCAICLAAYLDPKTLPCGHTFCSPCLKSCKDPKCPLCQSTFNNITAYHSVVIKQMVEELPARCIYFNFCSWNGQFGHLQDHVNNTCINREAQCLNQGCTFRCQQSYMYDHFKDCPHLLIKCPNDCGEAIQQGYLSEHECQCPQCKKNQKIETSPDIPRDYNLNDIPMETSNPIYECPILINDSKASTLQRLKEKAIPIRVIYWGIVNTQKKVRKTSIKNIQSLGSDRCRCILQGFLYKALDENHTYYKENILLSEKKWEFQFNLAANGYLLVSIMHKGQKQQDGVEAFFTIIFNSSQTLECSLKNRIYKSHNVHLWEIQHHINNLVNRTGDLDVTIVIRSIDLQGTPLLNLRRLSSPCRPETVAGQLQIPLDAIYLGTLKNYDTLRCAPAGFVDSLTVDSCRWILPKIINRVAAGERVFYSPGILCGDSHWEIRISINADSGFVYFAIFLKSNGQQKFVDATFSLNVHGQQEFMKTLENQLFKIKCGHLWELQRRLRSIVDPEKNLNLTVQIRQSNLTSRFLK